MSNPSKPWFRPKRYGYGSGLPIAWQGWVVYGVYFFVTIGTASGLPIVFPNPAVFFPVTMVVAVVASVILIVICARKTDGGWRWRNGDKD